MCTANVCDRTWDRLIGTLPPMQILVQQGREIPLSRLRGTKRPLIVAGTRGFVNKCLRNVEPYRDGLEKRGVCSVHHSLLFACKCIVPG